MSSWDNIYKDCKSRKDGCCVKQKESFGEGNKECEIRNCPKMTKVGNITIDCSCGYNEVHIKREGSYIYAVCHNCGSWEYLD